MIQLFGLYHGIPWGTFLQLVSDYFLVANLCLDGEPTSCINLAKTSLDIQPVREIFLLCQGNALNHWNGLSTGSSDYVTKFWCRQRSGDIWRDRHLQDLEESNPRDSNSFAKIPGVGVASEAPAMIPGIEDIGMKRNTSSTTIFPLL